MRSTSRFSLDRLAIGLTFGLILTGAAAPAQEPDPAQEQTQDQAPNDPAGVTTYAYDGSFDDAAFALENAIIGRGLVVDHVSHVGDMLQRTRADVGSEVKLYDNADMYSFCSAVMSRKMMEADPLNLAHCPYGIFVMEREGEVQIGFRDYPEGAMQDVQELLDEIAQDAVEGF